MKKSYAGQKSQEKKPGGPLVLERLVKGHAPYRANDWPQPRKTGQEIAEDRRTPTQTVLSTFQNTTVARFFEMRVPTGFRG
jgi:hypothetical protein